MGVFLALEFVRDKVHTVHDVCLLGVPLHCRSIERAAQHEAKRTEQKAKGELERQKLQNEKVPACLCHLGGCWQRSSGFLSTLTEYCLLSLFVFDLPADGYMCTVFWMYMHTCIHTYMYQYGLPNAYKLVVLLST